MTKTETGGKMSLLWCRLSVDRSTSKAHNVMYDTDEFRISQLVFHPSDLLAELSS